MSCGITSGVSTTCADSRRVGGVNRRAYVFNISDLADTKYTTDGDGYITAINFDTYKGLYEFTGRKKSHSGGYSLSKQQPGGNIFFLHDVIFKLLPDTPVEDEVIENLAVAEVGIILETNNQEFILYGGENGCEMTEGTQNTGQESASDISDILTFQGEEKSKPKRILSNNYATTKALLDSYVV